MSSETKKMLNIIDKQQKECYLELQRGLKKKKFLNKILIILLILCYILLCLDFIFIF